MPGALFHDSHVPSLYTSSPIWRDNPRSAPGGISAPKMFARVSRSSRWKKILQVLSALLVLCSGLILNITGQPTVPSSEADMAAHKGTWTCGTSRLSPESLLVLLSWFWLVVNGPLSPTVVILDVFLLERC